MEVSVRLGVDLYAGKSDAVGREQRHRVMQTELWCSGLESYCQRELGSKVMVQVYVVF